MNSDMIRNRVMDIESSPLGEAEKDGQIWSGIEADGTHFMVSRHVVSSPTRWMQIVALSLDGSAEGMSQIEDDFRNVYGEPDTYEDEGSSRFLEWCVEDPVFVDTPEPISTNENRCLRLLRLLRR